jgi:hypothetical protein
MVTPSSRAIADVAYATGTTVVGVGFQGATVLSADGGAQFPTLVSGGFQGAVSDVAPDFLRAGGAVGSAYLLGANGNIEATTDGGAAWKVLRVPGGGDLVDVAFPSTAHGYSVGDDDVPRKTANGGTTWSSLDAGVSTNTSLAATSATNVLLVGPVGIRRSTDGGQTFTKVPGTVSAGGTGYVLDAAGDVLGTRNTGKTWAPQLIDGGGGNGEGDIPPAVLVTNGHAYYDDPPVRTAAAPAPCSPPATAGRARRRRTWRSRSGPRSSRRRRSRASITIGSRSRASSTR